MANEWLRLWHEMPNDPKWRTIAKISQQPVALVQAVYLHLLVDASRNVTRGYFSVTHEDLASALDVPEQAIAAVFSAMNGRVLSGNFLTGWKRRQPKREDLGDPETGTKSAAQRKRNQRQREQDSPQDKCGRDASRNVTTEKEEDQEEDKEKDHHAAAEKLGVSHEETQNLMPHRWQPSAQSMAYLVNALGIPERFVVDAVPEFELYWRERGATSTNWDMVFRDHIRSQWGGHLRAQEDTKPHRIPESWVPSDEAYEVLRQGEIDIPFADSLLPEFVMYWRDTNQACVSWNARFLKHVNRKWNERLIRDESERSTRDISLHEQLTDRTWAHQATP